MDPNNPQQGPLDGEESDIEATRASEELNAAFYAAASAVSRFKQQCVLQEKRQIAMGYRRMVENIVSETKAQAVGGLVSVSGLLSYMRRQLLHLPLQECPALRELPSVGEGLDVQSVLLQTAAASLAQMQIQARQGRKRNAGLGGKQAIEFVARNLMPIEGQTLQEQVLLEFLAKQCVPTNCGGMSAGGEMSAEGARLQSWGQQQVPRVSVRAAGGEHGSPSGPSQGLRKRSREDYVGSLDPVFEQVFKRQCQPPPTPPRR